MLGQFRMRWVVAQQRYYREGARRDLRRWERAFYPRTEQGKTAFLFFISIPFKARGVDEPTGDICGKAMGAPIQ